MAYLSGLPQNLISRDLMFVDPAAVTSHPL